MKKNKEEYRKSNTVRIVLMLSAVLLALVLVGLWLQQKFFHAVTDIEAEVYPTTLMVGDTLFYVDNTPFSAIKEWSFGDGNLSVNDSGYYFYKYPGYYQVKLTLNGKYSKVYSIQVLEQVQETIVDSVTVIEAPKEAMQFENVVFRSNSKHAKLFSWKFGESGIIDSKEQMVIYAYQNPGDYIVSLFTDETEYPILHNIKILPSFKTITDSLSVEDVYLKIDNDFKYHLQQIANGSNFNTHYNYLKNKYLCGKEDVPTKVNTSKVNTFYYYCIGLQFDKNNIIYNVKVNFDDNMNCVNRIDVVQGK